MADTIRFLLGEAPRAVSGLAPTTTVLQYLREHERRCGTKEGCAEGDCGACTVVLASPDTDGGLAYRAVNSCIQFLPTLDGKQLLTVEDLKGADGALHPAQQAMVDCHGSQCGFCTPGFVMSLFALWHQQKNAATEDARQALAGNLCRCTGYRPILDAAKRMYDNGGPDRFDTARAATTAQLAALGRTTALAYEHAGQRFFAPRTRAELSDILRAHPDAHILAGGTDFGLWVTKQHRDFATIVSLGEFAALKDIRVGANTVEIGAGATLDEVLATLKFQLPSLQTFLLRFASVQIRNVATIGGNIANASPIGDLPPVLLALGASLVLAGPQGERTRPIDQFFLGYRKTALAPGEIIVAVRVPIPSQATSFAAYKVSKRFDQDISAVCAAFALTREGDRVSEVRLGYGGMAATPKRASAAEAALHGKPWTLESVRRAMQAMDSDFQPLSDCRGSAAYRALSARNLLLRFYHETIGADFDTQVAYG
jgi:xanthine dehydrogenase small subunit